MRFSSIFAAVQLLACAQAVWPEPSKMTNGSSVVWISPDVKLSYMPLSKRGVR